MGTNRSGLRVVTATRVSFLWSRQVRASEVVGLVGEIPSPLVAGQIAGEAVNPLRLSEATPMGKIPNERGPGILMGASQVV